MDNETMRLYESYYSMTNASLVNDTSTMEPLNLTEILINISPIFEILHEPFVHPLCNAATNNTDGTCRTCLQEFPTEGIL